MQQARTSLFWGLLVVLVLALLEGTSAVVEHLAPRWAGEPILTSRDLERNVRIAAEQILTDRPDALATFDPMLGWRPRAGLDNGVDVINAQGLRADREYAAHRTAGARVAVFGDSFVYGSEVEGDAAWPAQWERLRPSLEVLNYGVPGYGPDQAFLRFRAEGRTLAPDLVILAVTPPAARRVLTVSMAFQSAHPHFLGKPRFALDAAGELELIPNPLQGPEALRRIVDDPGSIHTLGRYDYFHDPFTNRNALYDGSHTVRVAATLGADLWRRYLDAERPLAGRPGAATLNSGSTGFRILTAIVTKFAEEARAWGMEPIVLLLPDGYSVRSSLAGGSSTLEPLADWCRDQPIECLDATDAFRAEPGEAEGWFFHWFHYTPEGNGRVARWLDHSLAGRLSDPAPSPRPAP